jgi:hypothetical protein
MGPASLAGPLTTDEHSTIDDAEDIHSRLFDDADDLRLGVTDSLSLATTSGSSSAWAVADLERGTHRRNIVEVAS